MTDVIGTIRAHLGIGGQRPIDRVDNAASQSISPHRRAELARPRGEMDYSRRC